MKKKKITFSMSVETIQALDVYAEENATNKSALIEKLVKKFLASTNNECNKIVNSSLSNSKRTNT